MPRTWKFHIVKDLVQKRDEFKWVLKGDQKKVTESDPFPDRAAARAAAREEIQAIQKAEIVDD